MASKCLEDTKTFCERHKEKILVAVIACGCVFLITGCSLIPVFDKDFKDGISESVVYTVGTMGYDRFRYPDDEEKFVKFWVFNVTNPQEVLRDIRPAKPVLEELGPYVYKVTRLKDHVYFPEERTQINYKSRDIFNFYRRDSVGNHMEDTFVTVNLPVLTIARTAEFYDDENRTKVESIINLTSSSIFQTYTVHDYLWGYSDPVVKIMEHVFPETFDDNTTFGLYFGKNNTNNNRFQIYSGTSNLELVNEIVKWQQQEEMDYWLRPWNNLLNGTDGTQYRPFLNKDDILQTFYTDQCRSYRTVFEEELKVANLNTFRFNLDLQNDEFCRFACLPEAFLNVTSCYVLPYARLLGIPFVTSYPHWYQAEPEELDRVEGLLPDKSKHQTTIDVEPNTGFALEVNRRLQFNAYIQPWTVFNDTLKPAFREGFIFPIAWFEEKTRVTDSFASNLDESFFKPRQQNDAIMYSLIGIGLFFLLTGLIGLIVVLLWERRKQPPPVPAKPANYVNDARDNHAFEPSDVYDEADADNTFRDGDGDGHTFPNTEKKWAPKVPPYPNEYAKDPTVTEEGQEEYEDVINTPMKRKTPEVLPYRQDFANDPTFTGEMEEEYEDVINEPVKRKKPAVLPKPGKKSVPNQSNDHEVESGYYDNVEIKLYENVDYRS